MVEFYWHVHHEELIEPLREPIENRISYIRQAKPIREVPTRLRLMRPVQNVDALPPDLRKAAEDIVAASAEYERVRAQRNSALNEYQYQRTPEAARLLSDEVDYLRTKERDLGFIVDRAHGRYADVLSKLYGELEVLHKRECPECPWNGWTIFPEDL